MSNTLSSRPFPASPRAREILFLAAVCLLVAFNLWLMLSLRLRAVGSAGLDDGLFVKYAESIIEGNWLGDYDQHTLAKGQFYSVFVAASFHAGIPSILAQQLLHVLACVIFMVAVRPLVQNRFILIVTFSLLLYDPFMYSETAIRITREGVYTSLVILILACACGLLLRHELAPRQLKGWSIGLGLALGAFWTTREEGIWLVPALALLMGFSMFSFWRSHASASMGHAGLLLLPLVLWAGGVLIVMGLNYRYYGAFDTVEFKNTAFKRADAAIGRVEIEPWRRYVLASKRTREALYEVSPTFADLKPYFDGRLGIQWGLLSKLNSFSAKVRDDDIAGGWFSWALRDVAALAGHHASAPEAAWFYNQLAGEINAACDEGRIRCRRKPMSMTPVLPWRSEYISLMVEQAPTAMEHAFQFSKIPVGMRSQNPLTSDLHRRDAFEYVSGSRLLSSVPEPGQSNADGKDDHQRYAIMKWLNAKYALVFRYLSPISLVAFLVMFFVACVDGVRRRTFAPSPSLVICTVLFVGVVSRLVLLLYITVSSFYTLTPLYIGPIYAMTIMFDCLAIGSFFGSRSILVESTRSRRRQGPRRSVQHDGFDKAGANTRDMS